MQKTLQTRAIHWRRCISIFDIAQKEQNEKCNASHEKSCPINTEKLVGRWMDKKVRKIDMHVDRCVQFL